MTSTGKTCRICCVPISRTTNCYTNRGFRCLRRERAFCSLLFNLHFF